MMRNTMNQRTLWFAAMAIVCLLACSHLVSAQIVTTYSPVVTYSVPAATCYTPVVAQAPVTTYYAPATTAYYAPATTAYYAPVATTAYYAPATTTVLTPVTTYYQGPRWVYDPTRILPRRRWRLVY